MKVKTFIFFVLLSTLSGCSGCSKSAQKLNNNQNNRSTASREERNVRSMGKTVVKMERQDGIYKIPVELNGSKMYFIFDTGASIISISETEATFLFKQGTLTEDDIIGKANFIDANGDISEGTIINLKTVRIGHITLNNIQASVVHNSSAPLLFGQSALEKFGKISIDYKKGEITLE